MSISQRIIKNTLWLYLRMGASILVNIFTTRILLQALGASDYGLYNVVGGAITMLGFLTASMSTSTQRFISYTLGKGEAEKLKSIFNNTLCVHYGIAGLSALILIAASFAWFNGVLNIPEGRETVAMCVYACLVFSTIYSITIVPYDGVLNAHENMRFYSIIGIIDVFVKLAIAIAVYFSTFDQLLLYAILMALEAWALRTVTKCYCSRHYEECRQQELRKYFDRKIARELMSFAGWNFCNIASAMIALHGTNLIINHYYGTLLNAAIGIATQLSNVLSNVSANLVKAITPILVKNEGAHQRKQVLTITYKGCKFSFLLFSFFSIPIMFYISPILELWLKDVPLYTAIFCLIMVSSAIIDQVGTVLYQTISAKGDIKGFSIAIMIPNIMIIIATPIMFSFGFSPYWGLINWLICKSIIGLIIRIFYSHIKTELSIMDFIYKVIFPIFKVCTFSCLICFVTVCAYNYFHINWMIMFSSSILLCIPIYWYTGLQNTEREMLINITKKVKNFTSFIH